MSQRQTKSDFLDCNGQKIHYRETGEGRPVLLLHGWPTSSHLYRNLLPVLGESRRAIAPDLPGFGLSSKPLEKKAYTFRFFENALESFVEQLGLGPVDLVVHDLGGPVGLWWAVQHPERIRSLVCLNTLVYPKPSWAVILFITATYVPGLKGFLGSPSGIARGMRFGVAQKEKLTAEVLRPYQEPFEEKAAQKALIQAAQRLSIKKFFQISKKLPGLQVPVRLIYGKKDWILPDIPKTMKRLQKTFPDAELTALENCGHFLQEDEPEKLATLLEDFFCQVDRAKGAS